MKNIYNGEKRGMVSGNNNIDANSYLFVEFSHTPNNNRLQFRQKLVEIAFTFIPGKSLLCSQLNPLCNGREVSLGTIETLWLLKTP